MTSLFTPADLRTLSWRTEVNLLSFEGEVEARPDHLVFRSPHNPTYYWGNFLLFREPPQVHELERWKQLFREAFPDVKQSSHISLAWDAPSGEWGAGKAFFDQGFMPDVGVVLTSREVLRPAGLNPTLQVRAIETDGEWAQVLANQLAEDDDQGEGYRRFKERKLAWHRRMAEAGRGRWFGAFLDGRLVGDCGLYSDGTLGRFQNVGTHPEYRRQGVCRTLMYEVSRWGFEQGQQEQVIVADEFYHAYGIYRSVGFEPRQRTVGVVLPGNAGRPAPLHGPLP